MILVSEKSRGTKKFLSPLFSLGGVENLAVQRLDKMR